MPSGFDTLDGNYHLSRSGGIGSLFRLSGDQSVRRQAARQLPGVVASGSCVAEWTEAVERIRSAELTL